MCVSERERERERERESEREIVFVWNEDREANQLCPSISKEDCWLTPQGGGVANRLCWGGVLQQLKNDRAQTNTL